MQLKIRVENKPVIARRPYEIKVDVAISFIVAKYMLNNYYVYIMTNKKNGVLYIGITNNLIRRVWEHKKKIKSLSFTSKYNIDNLVYFENYIDPENAILREKQLKAGSRKNKVNLIEKNNPDWDDLSEKF